MDNSNKGKSTKEEKVGPDGLTKKERRALKVQSRQTDDSKVELKKQDKTEKTEAKPAPPLKTQELPSLSEKELRKLEWQKKLAEQNVVKEDSKEALSKAELKAKRREKQEKQRSQKDTKPSVKEDEKVKKTPLESPMCVKSPSKVIKSIKTCLPKAGKVQLLQHLYTEELRRPSFENVIVNYKNVHPSFIRLGVQYATKTVLGSNARCISLLSALISLVKDLKTPPKQEFCRYLESVLQSCVNYLQYCRPFSVSMSNALKLFKLQLTQIGTNLHDDEKKKILIDFINTYVHNEILTAGEAISMKVSEKISNGDVILTYGCSSLIKKILEDAYKAGKQFKVIIVDGRPLLEGREMLRRLANIGIECSYTLINALSYVIPSASKVLLGAHALLTNGYVMSRAGTAQVALVAHAFNKPVLVCCETYKFSEKVQTDSLVYNEIGDESSLIHVDTLQDPSPLVLWKESSKLTPLNLLYDVTPPDLVTAVVTELAILPCTSVPVVLRLKPTEL